MIEWWVNQTGWLKFGIPIGLLAISSLLLLFETIWFEGFALGIVLLAGSFYFKDDPNLYYLRIIVISSLGSYPISSYNEL